MPGPAEKGNVHWRSTLVTLVVFVIVCSCKVLYIFIKETRPTVNSSPRAGLCAIFREHAAELLHNPPRPAAHGTATQKRDVAKPSGAPPCPSGTCGPLDELIPSKKYWPAREL